MVADFSHKKDAYVRRNVFLHKKLGSKNHHSLNIEAYFTSLYGILQNSYIVNYKCTSICRSLQRIHSNKILFCKLSLEITL